jgi:hypothetical protein
MCVFPCCALLCASFRKIAAAFARAVVVHRDEFQRFHRHKRTVAGRTAKAVKTWLETMEVRKEKADNREGR